MTKLFIILSLGGSLMGCGWIGLATKTGNMIKPVPAGTDKSIAKNAHLGIGKTDQSEHQHVTTLSDLHRENQQADTIINQKLESNKSILYWMLGLILAVIVVTLGSILILVKVQAKARNTLIEHIKKRN